MFCCFLSYICILAFYAFFFGWGDLENKFVIRYFCVDKSEVKCKFHKIFFTKYGRQTFYKTQFFTFGLEDHFRFLMLFLNKYLKISRIKIFDLNTKKKEKTVKSRSKSSESDSALLSLVIACCPLSLIHGYFCNHLTGFF